MVKEREISNTLVLQPKNQFKQTNCKPIHTSMHLQDLTRRL